MVETVILKNKDKTFFLKNKKSLVCFSKSKIGKYLLKKIVNPKKRITFASQKIVKIKF